MKNFPQLPTPNACTAEAQHIISGCNEIVKWMTEHRKVNHPEEPPLLRMIVVCDHGEDYMPLIAFAGQEPTSPEYVSDLLTKAWSAMTEARTEH
jgi:hypothetical protein